MMQGDLGDLRDGFDSLRESFVLMECLRLKDPKLWARFTERLERWAADTRDYIAMLEGRDDLTREQIEMGMPRL